MQLVFVDEAKERDYVVVAVAVPSADLKRLRRVVGSLRKQGQSRVHFVKESDRRRRVILSALCASGFRASVHVSLMSHDRDARAACLSSLVVGLSGSTSRLVLERDESIERWDRQFLYAALDHRGLRDRVSYSHERAANEPLLWVPDAIGWAYSRGGEWRRRVAPMVISVELADLPPESAKLGTPTVRKATELTSRR